MDKNNDREGDADQEDEVLRFELRAKGGVEAELRRSLEA